MHSTRERMAAAAQFYGTGRRKTSVARVWLRPGPGRILVNRRPFEDYFPRETLRMIIAQPLQLTNTVGQFDATINVGGGGPTGQAGAVRHRIAPGPLRFHVNPRPPPQRGGPPQRRPPRRRGKKERPPGARPQVPCLQREE